MLGKTHQIRRTGILVALGAAIAAFAVPAALGGVGPGFDGRSPDTKDAAAQAQLHRYAPSDAWLHSAVVRDGRSPDTKDAASDAQLALLAPADGRSPDTKDAALAARYQTVSIVESGGFDWGDFGIGIAAAVGGLLLLAALGAGLRKVQPRHRLGNA
jgi:hypothetical protein